MNTRWLPRISSASIKRLSQVNWVEILAFIGLGLVTALVMANLHLHLHLPGWRGLIWLLPLVTIRLLTNSFGAASITSFSAAGFSFLLGIHNNPFDWFFYLVVGEVLDLAYHLGQQRRNAVWFWTLVSGSVHLIKPLAMIVVSFAGVEAYGLFSNGYVYPFATHFLFGAAAGLIGSGAVLLAKRKEGKPKKG